MPRRPARTPLLAERRHRPGEAHGDRAVEQADVDAELECVGGGDAEEVTLDEPPLDLPALLRGVAGPVRRQPFAVAVSTRSAVNRWISSADFRDLVKQIVLSPRETSPASIREASPSVLARSRAPRR